MANEVNLPSTALHKSVKCFSPVAAHPLTVTMLTPAQHSAIQAASHHVLEEAVKFLQDLVQIDTTNPPGINYRQCAQLIANQLDALTYETELLQVNTKDLSTLAPHDADQNERVNVIGRLASSSKSPNLVTVGGKTRPKCLHFDGHFDIVPVGDETTWTQPPLGGKVVDGVIYGRGVSDMKGGIAAMVWAVEAVKRAGLTLRGTVEQSGVVDEESTGIRNAGAGWLVKQKIVSPETVDAVVITEPLNVENVCLGHRGTIWGEITFLGVASHGATPQRGVNALVHAANFIVKANQSIVPSIMDKSDVRVIPEEARGASLTFTVLNAGANTNSVPDRATLRFDRRLVPGETLQEAREQIHSVLEGMAKEDKTFRYKYDEMYSTEPVWVEEDLEICKVWREAVKHVVKQEPGIVCSPGSDDQRFFVRGGIEQTIVYGPGNIRNVHNKDEALDLEDLRKSIEVMAIGACEFLGVD